jgi:hypothetical protein
MEVKCLESSKCEWGHAFKANTCGLDSTEICFSNCPRWAKTTEELMTLLEAGGRDKGDN